MFGVEFGAGTATAYTPPRVKKLSFKAITFSITVHCGKSDQACAASDFEINAWASGVYYLQGSPGQDCRIIFCDIVASDSQSNWEQG